MCLYQRLYECTLWSFLSSLNYLTFKIVEIMYNTICLILKINMYLYGFPRQDHWSGLSTPSPGDLLDPGIKPAFPVTATLAGWFFTIKPPGKTLRGQILYEYIVTMLCSSLFKIFTEWVYIESIKGSLVQLHIVIEHI